MNPTGYVGVRPLNPGNITFHNRDPNNLQDVNNYQPGDTWMNTILNRIWMLMRDINIVGGGKQAVWVQITGGGGGAGIQNLTGDNAVIISPTANNCNIFGTTTQGIQTAGNLPSTMKITALNATAAAAIGLAQRGVCAFNSANFTVVNGFVSSVGGTGTMQTLSGDDAVAISPNGAGNTKILGTAAQGVVTSGVPLNNEVNITVNNATTAAKGVASFNPANFTVAAGVVSAIAPPGSIVWVAAPISAGMAVNKGYYITGAGVTLTLPALAAVGTVIRVQGTSLGWTVAQNAGQNIVFDGIFSTTPGVGGSVASVDTYDGLEILCVVANTTWVALNIKGNPTIV
jgi:hypothetical protein